MAEPARIPPEGAIRLELPPLEDTIAEVAVLVEGEYVGLGAALRAMEGRIVTAIAGRVCGRAGCEHLIERHTETTQRAFVAPGTVNHCRVTDCRCTAFIDGRMAR